MKRAIKYDTNRVQGILIGTLLGDSIGSGFEGCSPDDIPPLDFQYILTNPPKSYTDDTQMTISVFEEIAENGTINQQSLMQRFLRRFSPWRGYGGGMLEVIEMWRDGRDVESAAGVLYGGLGSFGNGAAMRAAPVSAFYLFDEVMEMVEQVRLCSMLTHTHPYGIGGAVLQSYAALLALNEIPTHEWMNFFLSFPIESAFKIKLEKVIRCLDRQASPHESAREIGNGADAMESVPAAIYAVMRNPDSFADTVLFAVSMGGDSDTIGAMAGALSGARLGIEQIPSEWLMNIENGKEGRDFIAGLAESARQQ